MEDNVRSLIPLPDASIAITRPGAGRVLSELVGDTLALARREPLFAIGEYQWCEPDYRQILLWAEVLALEPEEVIRRLLVRDSLYLNCDGKELGFCLYKTTAFRIGKMMGINWDLNLLPISPTRWLDKLEVEYAVHPGSDGKLGWGSGREGG